MVSKTIPNLFTAAQPQIASYDWTDIADRTGYITFYPYATEDSSGASYLLNRNLIYSSEIEAISSFEAGGIWRNAVTRNFDLSEFQTAQTIKGDAIVTATFYIYAGSGVTAEGYLRVTIQKVDVNDDASTIVTADGVTLTASSGEDYAINTIKLSIPRTAFAVGEKLRLQLVARGKCDITPAKVGFGTDPKNRDGTFITPSTDDPASITQVIFNCPFNIEI